MSALWRKQEVQPKEPRPHSEAWWWKYYAVGMLLCLELGISSKWKQNLKQSAAKLSLCFGFQHNNKQIIIK